MAQQPVPAPPRTVEELFALPDDGMRHELIDGVHYMTPSPVTKHQKVVGELFFALHGHVRANGLGVVLVAPMDVVVSKSSVVEPDILFISAAREAEIVGEKNITGAPDLVVEVLSTGTRKVDETTKRDFYGRVGCREYWIVDVDAETLRSFRASDAGTGFGRIPAEILEGDDRVTSPLLPGFELVLSTIFV